MEVGGGVPGGSFREMLAARRIARLSDELSPFVRWRWPLLAGFAGLCVPVCIGGVNPLSLLIGLELAVGCMVAAAGLGAYRVEAELERLDDPRAIGLMARSLPKAGGRLAQTLMRRLTALLPRLKASDGARLPANCRADLCKAIAQAAHRGAYARERDFILAALGALEQLGGEESVPCVQALADSSPRDEYERQIVDAAQACLPALRQRAAAATAASTLLRAAEAPDDAADVLLRPAAGVGETDPALLLRPAPSDPQPSIGDRP